MIRATIVSVLSGEAVSLGIAVLVAAPTLYASSSSLPRSTEDRPDDRGGAQVHVMYLLPSDGVDRALDSDGMLAASVKNWQTWLQGQTGGRGLFLDTSQGELDITFARLPQTDAQYAANGVYIRDAIERDLHAAGFNAPGKIYLAYYDGSGATCGAGPWPPDLVGNVAALYMRATFGQGLLCHDPSLSLRGLNYTDFAALHEVLHTIGIVATCAPHHTRRGHVSDSPTDLMYAGDEGWIPSVLDVGRDDYFEARIPGCLDLAESPFFGATEPTPPPSGDGNGDGESGGNSSPPAKIKLTVAVSGPGRVLSQPAGIACPKKCSATFKRGATITLRALPARRAKLLRWSGACSGSEGCRVRLDKARVVKARFKR